MGRLRTSSQPACSTTATARVQPDTISIFNFLPTRWITRQLQLLRGRMPDDTTITQDPITSFATPQTQPARHLGYLVNLFDKRITPARALVLCLALVAV